MERRSHNFAWQIREKFLNKVHVIWYQADENENSTDLFTRLNIGKIPLTNAELVKALFLSRKESKKRKEKFFTFYHFSKMIQEKFENNKKNLWQEIKQNFEHLKEWFEDKEFYHKIGYLIAADSINLNELLQESKEKTKTEIRSEIDDKIAQSINFKVDYSDLSYDKNYDENEKLLLLFNVESTRQINDPLLKFPFANHKNKQWSLEHISLLEKNLFDAGSLNDFADSYIKNPAVQKDWRYYLIKYDSMRSGKFGMYYWETKNKKEKPYELIMMNTEKSTNGYNWEIFSRCLQQKFPENLSLGNYATYGNLLLLKGKNITVEVLNSEIVLKNDDKTVEQIPVPQNKDGIDETDRVELLEAKLKTYF